MELIVSSITPIDAALNQPIDSKITIEFNQPIDPFTVQKGISLYTPTDKLWIGSELSILDTRYKDVMDIGEEYSYFQYDYTINGNILTITPQESLLPERKYYIAIFPGNDASRYVSSLTVSDPVITRVGSSDGSVNILSSFLGNTACSIELTFNGAGSFDVVKDGLTYIGSFNYIENEEVSLGSDLGNLKISVSGAFDDGDTVDIDLFPASGTTSIYRTSFTTSKYTQAIPSKQSVRVTDLSQVSIARAKLAIIKSIPENNSINNARCNPVTLKFNATIDPNQNLSEIIIVKRKHIITDVERRINFFYKITGDTVKLFLTTVQ